MANTVDHTHGDNGDKPVDGLNFQNGDVPDPEVFDWFWTEVPSAINNHAQLLEQIDTNDDGVVDEAETAQDTAAYKGNDIDKDGDGKVNAADTADNADEAATASGLTNVSHSELADAPDSAHHTRYTDAEAEAAAPVQTVNGQTGDVSVTTDGGSNATSYKGNDIDSDGDGKVESAEIADEAKGLDGVYHFELDGVDSDDHHSRYTDDEAESAAPVQSVNGQTGDVTVDESGGSDATSYKGNDIDNDGDGKVNSAEVADSAKTYKGTDIDTNGDGKVDAADTADQADNATTVKGNDIDADGDGKVDAAEDADVAAGLTGVAHSELTDAPADAHHSEQHGANQHNTDDLHNTAVTIPSYATKSDVPSLAEGQMVYIENDNAFYFEDGT